MIFGRSFLAALGFLTFLPIPARWSGGSRELGKSVYFFPVVGLLLGALTSVLDHVIGRVVQVPELQNTATLLVMVGVSRGLHLDGLADTADGFMSSRPPPRVLEIMRDSRLGTFGALAIFGVLMLKWSALGALGPDLRPWALVFAPLAGRAALVFQLSVLDYARQEGGLAGFRVSDVTTCKNFA